MQRQCLEKLFYRHDRLLCQRPVQLQVYRNRCFFLLHTNAVSVAARDSANTKQAKPMTVELKLMSLAFNTAMRTTAKRELEKVTPHITMVGQVARLMFTYILRPGSSLRTRTLWPERFQVLVA